MTREREPIKMKIIQIRDYITLIERQHENAFSIDYICSCNVC